MPDLGKSRRKLKIAIGAMLAVDVIAVTVLFSPLVGFRGFAEAANPRTQGRTDQEEPRSRTAARHGQEDRSGQESDRRVLQGPLCRDRFRTGQ